MAAAQKDLKNKIAELADLMDEFGLNQARLSGDGWAVAFSRDLEPVRTVSQAVNVPESQAKPAKKSKPKEVAAPQVQKGTPISSPMMGIYYSAPSPGADPFVKPGDAVSAGQVVALIEAMKVFNEITAPVNGIVASLAAENGQLVQPGDPLIYVS